MGGLGGEGLMQPSDPLRDGYVMQALQLSQFFAELVLFEPSNTTKRVDQRGAGMVTPFGSWYRLTPDIVVGAVVFSRSIKYHQGAVFQTGRQQRAVALSSCNFCRALGIKSQGGFSQLVCFPQ